MTITTTGYGDLTAASGIGRMTAVLEAIFGQLYLITVVALVVQNLGQQSRMGRKMEEQLEATTAAADAAAARGAGRAGRPPATSRTPAAARDEARLAAPSGSWTRAGPTGQGVP